MTSAERALQWVALAKQRPNDHLGDAYWAAGRTTEARYQWQRAITLVENQDEIEDLRRKLLTGPKPYPAQAQRP